MIGRSISHYRIEEKLGEGGMGVVYKAHDTKLDRTVALKFFPQHLTPSEEDKQRFIREAKAAAGLNHPHICTIYSVEEYDGQQFISMEYIDGVTLREKSPMAIGARSQRSETPQPGTWNLEPGTAIDYALQIAEALAEAHERDIVHRDIKPDNIMVDAKNRIKVMDFGLAKLKGAMNVTKFGSTVGTVAYMSPEQIQAQDVDHRSDIFSFGILLFEMFTGKLPFRGEHESAMYYSIMNEEPGLITDYLPDISPDIVHIIERSLEKEKTDRYQTMNDIATELQRIKKKSSRAITAAAAEQSTKELPADNISAGPQWRRKKQLLIIALLVALLMLILYIFTPERVEQPAEAAAERLSIAVLPFENLSPDPDNEYFTDGITEDIIIQLSKISNLRVMSRSSMMRYKGSEKSVQQIGGELGVGRILEGSVRRAGNRVRINSQLIDINTNESLWGETYDRTIEDIFSIQSDVATQIASALKITLTPDEKRYIERQPTANIEAYDYYLRGREYYSRYRREHNENAIELFKRAITIDPDFALAFAGLADAYGQRVLRFNYESIWLDSAVTAGQKAVSLDPNAAEGYKALGLAYIASGKFRKAIEQNIKAVNLSPNHEIAYMNTGLVFLASGDFGNAKKWIENASQLRSPTDPWPYYGFGVLNLYQDNIEQANQYLRQSLFYMPDFDSPRITLAISLILSGQLTQAQRESEFLLQLDPQNTSFINLKALIQILDNDFEGALVSYGKTGMPHSGIIGLGTMKFSSPGIAYVYKQKGDRANFEMYIQKRISETLREIESGNEHFIYPYLLATSYAMLNERDKACEYLEKAVSYGWRHYRFAMKDPSFNEMRDDTRFRHILDNVRSIVEQENKRISMTK